MTCCMTDLFSGIFINSIHDTPAMPDRPGEVYIRCPKCNHVNAVLVAHINMLLPEQKFTCMNFHCDAMVWFVPWKVLTNTGNTWQGTVKPGVRGWYFPWELGGSRTPIARPRRDSDILR